MIERPRTKLDAASERGIQMRLIEHEHEPGEEEEEEEEKEVKKTTWR